MGQDHPDLCRLLRPPGEPRLWQLHPGAARGPEVEKATSRRGIATVRTLKHLPEAEWPTQDVQAFVAAYADGDIFDDDRGAGAHLRATSRNSIRMGWRRWLGFLSRQDADALALAPAD